MPYFSSNTNVLFTLIIAVLVGALGCQQKTVDDISQQPLETDCNSVPGGSAYLDNCGKCVGGSTGTQPCETDCFGTWGGQGFVDDCGNCVGGEEGTEPCRVDCNGVPLGEAFVDDCGNCVGGNTGDEPCEEDCHGDLGGEAVLDECGECVGGATGEVACQRDCSGELGGTATRDNCGSCVGGTTGEEACVKDCMGVWGGDAVADNCGVCNGSNTSCVQDCAGIWGGINAMDACGVCDSDPSNDNLVLPNGLVCLQDCAGNFGGSALVDDCGVCDSDPHNNNTLLPNGNLCLKDCAGVWGGSARVDECGVCDALSTNDCLQDCAGLWGGSAEVDICGDCGGEGRGCLDCNDDYMGTAVLDACGVCYGGNTGRISECRSGCEGEGTYVDQCGDCVGGDTGRNPCVEDCMGVAGGAAVTDNCNRCVGGTSGLEACIADCTGAFGGGAFVDECSECVGGSTGLRPCVRNCNGTFEGTYAIVPCPDGDQCMDLSLDVSDLCNPDCEGVVDCNGVCGGLATFDMCSICDDDDSNNCVADCRGTYGGTAHLDACGTCDNDYSNDCGIVSYVEAFNVLTSTYGENMEYQVQHVEIDLANFGVNDPLRPDCEPDTTFNPNSTICTRSKMVVTDFRVPQEPEIIGSMDLPNKVVDIAVSSDQQKILLVAPGKGLNIANVLLSDPYVQLIENAGEAGTELALRPSELPNQGNSVDLGIPVAVAVAEANGYAYVVYANKLIPRARASGGLHIVNLTTLEEESYTPFPANKGAWDIVVRGDAAYLAGGPNGLLVMDVTDKKNPSLKSIIAPSSEHDSFNTFSRLAYGSDILVVATEAGGEVFKVVDPFSPQSTGVFVTTHPMDIEIDSRLIEGNRTIVIFLADQSNGMSIYTLDESLAPSLRGTLELPIPQEECLGSEDSLAACSTSALNIEVRGNLAYVTTDRGLFSINLGF